MFIKDTGEARDLRTIQVKELQAIVRSLYKSYGYHRKEYETGFNPPVHRRDLALREIELAWRNMSAYQSYLCFKGQDVPSLVDAAIENYFRWIEQAADAINRDLLEAREAAEAKAREDTEDLAAEQRMQEGSSKGKSRFLDGFPSLPPKLTNIFSRERPSSTPPRMSGAVPEPAHHDQPPEWNEDFFAYLARRRKNLQKNKNAGERPKTPIGKPPGSTPRSTRSIPAEESTSSEEGSLLSRPPSGSGGTETPPPEEDEPPQEEPKKGRKTFQGLRGLSTCETPAQTLAEETVHRPVRPAQLSRIPRATTSPQESILGGTEGKPLGLQPRGRVLLGHWRWLSPTLRQTSASRHRHRTPFP